MNFKEDIKNRIAFVDEALNRIMPGEDMYPETIFKAMRYSVFAGGKRLRPIMLLEACRMFGGDEQEALCYACAIEMIHTYSLIHDDLPALDNDDFRRGRLTSHKVFGENIAILAGDALLSEAFELMSGDALAKKELRFVRAMKYIAQAAGNRGMIAGQVVDVLSEGSSIDKATLDFIHANKTAAMIQGALKAGAAVADASNEEIELLGEAGLKIGIAFQVQDDILDVTSTTEVLGKPVKSDEKNQKQTYATMYGIEKSRQIVSDLTDEAIEILMKLNGKSEFLIELINYLVNRKF